MKVSDYIVEFLIQKNICDVFGYPGGMVTHLMESFRKYRGQIFAHVTYHEQGAAFAACGYAQASGRPGVAYATSGPGATNLLTGICNAYFDSIPTIFITGQVNTNEAHGELGVRQRGFQETDIVPMVSGVTKYAVYVSEAQDIRYCLEKAYHIAMSGRKGPVLLDIPMNILRTEVDPDKLATYVADCEENEGTADWKKELVESLRKARRPCILLGNGVKIANAQALAIRAVENLQIPSVTSMIAVDILGSQPLNYGFIGAYGDRCANFIVSKCDLLICIGTRLDVRQVGGHREQFAPKAKIIRMDIDRGEMTYPVRNDEVQLLVSAEEALDYLASVELHVDYEDWIAVCDELRDRLADCSAFTIGNQVVEQISNVLCAGSIITTDVGQNQVWVAQSLKRKNGQRIFFSGGHGAMGYSLPAAIGAYYGSGKKCVYSVSGDGGFQMNVQELQFIARENLPIKLIVLNNHALGMIRHFQEMYFNKAEFQTNLSGGYSVPDFAAIARAYGIDSKKITDLQELSSEIWNSPEKPMLLEVQIDTDTYVFPKLEFGKPNQDQEPLIDRETYKELMDL